MPTFDYSQISDFAKDQLFGYAQANVLRRSIRYIAEDILGNPASFSNVCRSLPMGNGAIDGGTLYFDGGTTSYIQSTSASRFSVAGMDVAIATPNVMRGTRMLYFEPGGISASGRYTVDNGTSDLGVTMPRAGSVIGYGLYYYVTSFTGSGTLTPIIKKNTTSLISGTGISITALNQEATPYQTYTRGTYTFAAGDTIQGHATFTGTYAVAMCFVHEVVFDT